MEETTKKSARPWVTWLLLAATPVMLIPSAMQSLADYHRSSELTEAVDAHRARAAKALEDNRIPRALAALEKARVLDPRSPDVQQDVMHALVVQAAQQTERLAPGQFEGLEDAIDGLVAAGRSAETPAYLVARAHVLIRRGQADEAVPLLDNAAAAGYVHAHLALGMLYRNQAKPLEALAAFEAAARLEPPSETALNNLGVQYQELGRPEEAIAALQKALKVRDNAASRINLGQALANMKRTKEALVHYKRAVELAPNNTAALRGLAGLAAGANDLPLAEALLTRSLKLKPDTTVALELGIVLQARKKLDDAARVLGGVLESAPDSREAAFRLAQVWHSKGERDKAIAGYKRFLELAKGVPEEAERVAKVQKLLTPPKPAPAPPKVAPRPTPSAPVVAPKATPKRTAPKTTPKVRIIP